MEPSGFCWKCGLPCDPGELFCKPPKKCKERHERVQARQMRFGKRAGYGVSGSTH